MGVITCLGREDSLQQLVAPAPATLYAYGVNNYYLAYVALEEEEHGGEQLSMSLLNLQPMGGRRWSPCDGGGRFISSTAIMYIFNIVYLGGGGRRAAPPAYHLPA